MARTIRRSTTSATSPKAKPYRHPEADVLLRPDVGTQLQFKKKKPPAPYRYDSSLSPALDWDGQNPARDTGEWLLELIEQAAALWDHLAGARSAPFEEGEHREVAVKVIDDRGNELLVVKKLDEAEG